MVDRVSSYRAAAVLLAALLGGQAGAQTVPPTVATPSGSEAPSPPEANRNLPAPVNQSGSGYGALSAYSTDSVVGRARPGFDPLSLPVGSFKLYWSATVSGFYDTNIYALPNAPVSGGGVQVLPQATLQSDWARNSLSALVSGNVSRYFGQGIDNSESVSGTANGRLDVGSDGNVFSSLTLARRVEPRGSEYVGVGLANVSSPIAYRDLDGSLNVQKHFGGLLVNAGGAYGQFRYESIRVGTTRVSLRDSNSDELGANARVQYEIGPGLGLFAAGNYNDTRVRASVIYPDRNSHGYTALGGLAFGVTRLLTGEVGLGYIHQSFASPLYGTVSGLDYSLKVNYAPSPLLDVHANFGRSFQRTVLLNSAGIEVDSFGASLDYELRRNILLGTGLTYSIFDYRGLNQRVHGLDNNYSARYLINRHFSLVGNIALSRQRQAFISQFGTGFDRAVFSLGVRVQQ